MINLALVKIGAVIITQEYVIQLLVVEIAHHFAAETLALGAGSVLDFLLELLHPLLLLIKKCSVSLRKVINTVVAVLLGRQRLRARLLVEVLGDVAFEANVADALVFVPIGRQARGALRVFPFGFGRLLNFVEAHEVASYWRQIILKPAGPFIVARRLRAVPLTVTGCGHEVLEAGAFELGVPHVFFLDLTDGVAHFLVLLHHLLKLHLKGPLVADRHV